MADALWDNAAFGVGSPAETAEKVPNLWDKLFSGAVNSLATLPQRAIENSQYALNSGYYDPSVPVEAALTMMGGGVGGVEGEGAALGSGPARMRMVDNVDLYKELANQRRAQGLSVGKSASGWDFVRPQAEKGSWDDLVARTKAAWEGDKARAIGDFEQVAPGAVPRSPYMTDEDYAEVAKPSFSLGAGATDAKTGALITGANQGIKYLDQGSRTAGQGSSNYVVFDDKIIDLMRKYGLALPGGAAAADVYTRSHEPAT